MSGTPASSSPGITGFIEIFEGRLNKMKLHIKEELSKTNSISIQNKGIYLLKALVDGKSIIRKIVVE